MYLEVHHLTYYCQNGTTTPGNLTFLDGQGRNLGQQHQLEVDWFLGWPGSQDDSHRALKLSAVGTASYDRC